jgi:hypothetical protein
MVDGVADSAAEVLEAGEADLADLAADQAAVEALQEDGNVLFKAQT